MVDNRITAPMEVLAIEEKKASEMEEAPSPSPPPPEPVMVEEPVVAESPDLLVFLFTFPCNSYQNCCLGNFQVC